MSVLTLSLPELGWFHYFLSYQDNIILILIKEETKLHNLVILFTRAKLYFTVYII